MTGGGKAWLRTGWGAGAGAGPPVWDAVQPWCSRALTHGLGPCGLWGSEDIFSMESSRWRSLSGELSAPSRCRPSLWQRAVRSSGRASLLDLPRAWAEVGAPGRGQSGGPWCLVSPQKELPCASSVLGRGGGTRQRTSRSGCRVTDTIAALALCGKLAGVQRYKKRTVLWVGAQLKWQTLEYLLKLLILGAGTPKPLHGTGGEAPLCLGGHQGWLAPGRHRMPNG